MEGVRRADVAAECLAVDIISTFANTPKIQQKHEGQFKNPAPQSVSFSAEQLPTAVIRRFTGFQGLVIAHAAFNLQT